MNAGLYLFPDAILQRRKRFGQPERDFTEPAIDGSDFHRNMQTIMIKLAGAIAGHASNHASSLSFDATRYVLQPQNGQNSEKYNTSLDLSIL
jgi:hypothetical protein